MVEIIINMTCKEMMISLNKYKGIVKVKMRAMNFILKFITFAHLVMGFYG